METPTKRLDLNSILQKEKESLSSLRSELSQKGWAIVNLPDDLVTVLDKCIDPIEFFFSLPESKKREFTWNHVFGFTSVVHKESFRWLTKDLLQPSMFPNSLSDCLIELTKLMDSLMIELISSTGTVLFDHPESLDIEYKIPLLNKAPHPRWSMLDIAYYFNNEKKFATSDLIVDENCAPHYDPGLLSLSVLSTHRGLELYNPITDEWVSHTGEDTKLGVIWCGKAAQQASSGYLRPAVHKVIRQLDKPRIAIWYEICNAYQIPEPARPLVIDMINEKSSIKLTPPPPSKPEDLSPPQSPPKPEDLSPPQSPPKPEDLSPSPSKTSLLESMWNSVKTAFTDDKNNNNNKSNSNKKKSERHTGIPRTKVGYRPSKPPNTEEKFERHTGIPQTKVMEIPSKPPKTEAKKKSERHTGIPITKFPPGYKDAFTLPKN